MRTYCDCRVINALMDSSDQLTLHAAAEKLGIGNHKEMDYDSLRMAIIMWPKGIELREASLPVDPCYGRDTAVDCYVDASAKYRAAKDGIEAKQRLRNE